LSKAEDPEKMLNQIVLETMAGLKDGSAFETFDRMSEKVDQIEAAALKSKISGTSES